MIAHAAVPKRFSRYQLTREDVLAGRKFEDIEPNLRREHRSTGNDDAWEHLREEVREGFDRARR